MPKVSRWSLEDRREKELLNQLWTAFTLLGDKKEVIAFLKAVLMPSEAIMLAKRIEMTKLHDANLSFENIRKLLHITKVTAYRWKERYERYHQEFKLIIDRLEKIEGKKLAKEAKRREPIKSRKRTPLLASAIGAGVIIGYRKLKKMSRLKSAEKDIGVS